MPDLPSVTVAEDRRRLEELTSKTWSVISEDEHPLGGLQDLSLGPYRLLALLGPKNNVGARYFQLFLVDGEGRMSREPIVFGMHNSGPYPGYNWLEAIRYQPSPRLGGRSVDVRAQDLEGGLFQALSALVPAGGHLMVEYDSRSQRDSERMLGLGYPPAATPLGYLLFRSGCRSFRDWYIPEGGREGPRKLQGFKPLNEEIAADKTHRLREELERLLDSPKSPHHGERGQTARRLASAVLEDLGVASSS